MRFQYFICILLLSSHARAASGALLPSSPYDISEPFFENPDGSYSPHTFIASDGEGASSSGMLQKRHSKGHCMKSKRAKKGRHCHVSAPIETNGAPEPFHMTLMPPSYPLYSVTFDGSRKPLCTRTRVVVHDTPTLLMASEGPTTTTTSTISFLPSLTNAIITEAEPVTFASSSSVPSMISMLSNDLKLSSSYAMSSPASSSMSMPMMPMPSSVADVYPDLTMPSQPTTNTVTSKMNASDVDFNDLVDRMKSMAQQTMSRVAPHTVVKTLTETQTTTSVSVSVSMSVSVSVSTSTFTSTSTSLVSTISTRVLPGSTTHTTVTDTIREPPMLVSGPTVRITETIREPSKMVTETVREPPHTLMETIRETIYPSAAVAVANISSSLSSSSAMPIVSSACVLVPSKPGSLSWNTSNGMDCTTTLTTTLYQTPVVPSTTTVHVSVSTAMSHASCNSTTKTSSSTSVKSTTTSSVPSHTNTSATLTTILTTISLTPTTTFNNSHCETHVVTMAPFSMAQSCSCSQSIAMPSQCTVPITNVTTSTGTVAGTGTGTGTINLTATGEGTHRKFNSSLLYSLLACLEDNQ